ncbi:ORC6 family protein [Megaselia abdita]
MSSELIDQLSKKLGLYDELKTQAKSRELIRLLDIRSTQSVQHIGEYAKVVICIDLAANLLNVGLDTENALKVSGLKKSQYLNNKRMFEKILDLNKPLTINDICIQLGAQEVSKKAKDLFEFYKSHNKDLADNEDISHPQYATMAVYQAGKILKKKIPKQKITSLSHLKPVQWTNLEKKWDKFIDENPNLKTDLSLVKRVIKEDEENQKPQKSQEKVKKVKVTIQPYEDWKNNMLDFARSGLAIQKEMEEKKKQELLQHQEMSQQQQAA